MEDTFFGGWIECSCICAKCQSNVFCLNENSHMVCFKENIHVLGHGGIRKNDEDIGWWKWKGKWVRGRKREKEIQSQSRWEWVREREVDGDRLAKRMSCLVYDFWLKKNLAVFVSSNTPQTHLAFGQKLYPNQH